MKVTLLKENLSRGLNIVGRIVSTRGSLEVLSNILIKTEQGRISISATNLEVGITYLIGGKVEEEGAITVPARLFHEFVTSLPSDKITLELKSETLHCHSDNYESNIKGISADEFPLIPETKENKVLSVKVSDLKEAVSLVGFAAAIDDARPVLSGVYFKVEGDKLIMAATDSYRLAEKEVILGEKKHKKQEAIIPARTLLELGRILGEIDGEETVSVYISQNQILFEADGLDFTSRLIEGQFPNYTQIIPDSTETTATVSKDEFVNAVKVASLFARENANSVKISLKNKGVIEIASQGSQSGDNQARIKAEVEGKDGEILFNGKYILDALGALKETDISFSISGRLNPGMITSKDAKSYRYIIMPLRS